MLTDLVDEVIPTQPLEHRAGVETIRNKSNIEDGANLVSISHTVRKALDLPEWRQHTDSELLILQGSLNTSISIDKITQFSLRPPELRFFFDQPGIYYRYVFLLQFFCNINIILYYISKYDSLYIGGFIYQRKCHQLMS